MRMLHAISLFAQQADPDSFSGGIEIMLFIVGAILTLGLAAVFMYILTRQERK